MMFNICSIELSHKTRNIFIMLWPRGVTPGRVTDSSIYISWRKRKFAENGSIIFAMLPADNIGAWEGDSFLSFSSCASAVENFSTTKQKGCWELMSYFLPRYTIFKAPLQSSYEWMKLLQLVHVHLRQTNWWYEAWKKDKMPCNTFHFSRGKKLDQELHLNAIKRQLVI